MIYFLPAVKCIRVLQIESYHYNGFSLMYYIQLYYAHSFHQSLLQNKKDNAATASCQYKTKLAAFRHIFKVITIPK